MLDFREVHEALKDLYIINGDYIVEYDEENDPDADYVDIKIMEEYGDEQYDVDYITLDKHDLDYDTIRHKVWCVIGNTPIADIIAGNISSCVEDFVEEE